MTAQQLLEGESAKAFLLRRGKRSGSEAFVQTGVSDAYLDYVRYPKGWGKDGTDRVETVFFDKRHKTWNAYVRHISLDSRVWYERAAMDGFESKEAAAAWLRHNRRTAPKLKK
jgi:hypothetical protein